MKTFVISIFILITSLSYSQETEDFSYMVPVGFVVVNSFDTYQKAHSFAEGAAEHLSIDFEISALHNEEVGIPNTDTCGCGIVHGYYHRGRFDAGSYLSIERTADYSDLNEKAFVVFSYCGVLTDGKSEELEIHLDLTQEIYKNAYIHKDEAYFGCMH